MNDRECNICSTEFWSNGQGICAMCFDGTGPINTCYAPVPSICLDLLQFERKGRDGREVTIRK